MNNVQGTEFWWLQPPRFFEHRGRYVSQCERIEHLPGSHKPIGSSPTNRSAAPYERDHKQPVSWFALQPRPRRFGLGLENYELHQS